MFDVIWNWIVENKQWVFSGIGVFVIGLFFSKNKHMLAFAKRIILFIPNQFKSIIIKKQKQNSNYDDSLFISESPSDGVTIPVGKVFKKSWTVKNNGNIIWEKRTLRCVEYVNDCFYPVSNPIKIPKTLPGQIVTLRVEYYAKVVGDYHSKWKMFDKNNNIIYPNKPIGLGVNISVRKNEIE